MNLFEFYAFMYHFKREQSELPLNSFKWGHARQIMLTVRYNEKYETHDALDFFTSIQLHFDFFYTYIYKT